jgi:exosortase H (IPTLxxWG-CTERM-specific)
MPRALFVREGPMEPMTSRSPNAAFVARFATVLVVLYLVMALNWVNDHAIVPFTGFVVRTTAIVLRFVREPVVVDGTIIRGQHFALDVKNGCNGVEGMLLLTAAVVAFPATLRSRLLGLAAGSLAIGIINIVRVTSLVWLGEHHRTQFDLFHVAVWQTVVVLASLAIFTIWSWKFAERPSAATR